MKLTQAERILRRAQKSEKPATPTAVAAPAVTRAPLAEVPVEIWHRCYDVSWRGEITAESFAHPAKAGRALLGRIYDHLFACGALSKGGRVLDPFGGIGTTAIIGAYRGCAVTCCELEPRFVALAHENIELHRHAWETLGVPIPVIIQGDSRRLRESLRHADAIISSPPYAEISTGAGGLNTQPGEAHQQSGRSASAASQDTDQRYGDTAGQLARLDKGLVDAVVSSPPPYEESSVISSGVQRNEYAWGSGTDLSAGKSKDYGTTPGQLGALPSDSVDAVISSPPYESAISERGGRQTATEPRVDEHGEAYPQESQLKPYGDAPGQLGALEPGHLDAVVSSPPPYEDQGLKGGDQRTALGDPSNVEHEQGRGKCTASLGRDGSTDYGDAPGQLGSMESGHLDAVVSSPPYATDQFGGGGEKHDKVIDAMKEGYGEEPGQLGAMESDGIDAVISSPPFGSGDSASAQSMTTRTDKSAQWVKNNVGSAGTEGYGIAPGQLAQMPMTDAVLSSPPYSGAGLGASAESEGPNGRPTENKGASQPGDQYGSTPGQLNHEPEDTFWSASAKIVQECHSLLRPGGVAVWIVKAFVRDKAVVDFPGDWRRLCEWVGFETVLEVHAMLVRTTESGTNLMGEEYVETVARKSFFRRLAESKGSPRIDHECVYIMRKR